MRAPFCPPGISWRLWRNPGNSAILRRMIWDPELREEHIGRERAKARELRQSQWWRQQIGPGLCHHCGGKFPKNQLTMDHLIPLARGGKTTKGNVVVACRPCNAARGHVLDVERTMDRLQDEARPGATSAFGSDSDIQNVE